MNNTQSASHTYGALTFWAIESSIAAGEWRRHLEVTPRLVDVPAAIDDRVRDEFIASAVLDLPAPVAHEGPRSRMGQLAELLANRRMLGRDIDRFFRRDGSEPLIGRRSGR